MLFHSVTFLVFFAITVLLLLILRRHRTQKMVLFVTSVTFYMWWNPAFILLQKRQPQPTNPPRPPSPIFRALVHEIANVISICLKTSNA